MWVNCRVSLQEVRELQQFYKKSLNELHAFLSAGVAHAHSGHSEITQRSELITNVPETARWKLEWPLLYPHLNLRFDKTVTNMRKNGALAVSFNLAQFVSAAFSTSSTLPLPIHRPFSLNRRIETRIPFSSPWQTNYRLECGCGGEGGGY